MKINDIRSAILSAARLTAVGLPPEERERVLAPIEELFDLWGNRDIDDDASEDDEEVRNV